MTTPEAAARADPDRPDPPRESVRGKALRSRYTKADLRVFTRAEMSRFVPSADADPRADMSLAWELLYRIEPELYDRLASAERLHPGVLGWLPCDVDRITELGAGTGRLTMELVKRGQRVVAVEPALPLRRILRRKLAAAEHGDRARVISGFFDRVRLPDDSADLVVACSAFTPSPGHGGEAGLAEMERMCRPGGCVAIVWPNHCEWLAARGYRHISFPGPMSVEFGSLPDAVELAEVFFPKAVDEVLRRGRGSVPFEVLGINPPRDVAFKVLPR